MYQRNDHATQTPRLPAGSYQCAFAAITLMGLGAVRQAREISELLTTLANRPANEDNEQA